MITENDIPWENPKKKPDEPVESTFGVDADKYPRPDYFLGQEVTVRRHGKNGAPDSFESGWKVVNLNFETGIYTVRSPDGVHEKEYTPDLLKSFQTKIDEDILPQAADAAKAAMGEALSGLERQGLHTDAAEDMSEIAVAEVIEDEPMSHEVPDYVPESVKINDQLKYLTDMLPSDSDRVAVWRYAIAINDQERQLALDLMNPGVRNIGQHETYKTLFEQLKAARIQEGILPPK